MGLLNINNGVSQEKGITYTVIIDDISNDFGDVSNNTYFLDKQTQLVYYKNSTGDLVSIYEQGGSDITGSAGNGLTYNTTTGQIDLGGDIGIDPDPTKNDLYFTPVSHGVFINYGLTSDDYASTFTSSGLVETYKIVRIRTHTSDGYEHMIGPFNNGNHLPGNPVREGVFEKQGPITYLKSYQNLTPSFDSNSKYVAGFTGDGITHYISESLNSTYRTIFDTHTGTTQPLIKSKSTHVLDNFTWEVSNEDTVDPTIERSTSFVIRRTDIGASVPSDDGSNMGMFMLRSDSINLMDGTNSGIMTAPDWVFIGKFGGSGLELGSGTFPSGNKFKDGSNDKKGIKYSGFGETPADEDTGVGADYSTLVNTSLVPKKYVDDSILDINTIYNADDILTGDRIVNLDNNSLTFDIGTLTSGTNNTLGLIIDGSNIYYGGGSNSSPLLQVEGELGNVLNVNSGGYLLCTSDYNDAVARFEKRGTNKGFGVGATKNTSGVQTVQHKPLLNSPSTKMFQQTVSNSLIDWQISFDTGTTGISNPNVQHWIRHGDAAAQVSFFRNGIGSSNFKVGGASLIGTEDISLQGDTLVSKKLELSSKSHGILLNRVDISEMNSISASDNEIVYNTELESLYRYDDPSGSWIALASGYGMVGVVRDSNNGVPTFYSDLQSALDTCKTVGSYNTVTLYSNHTTTTGIIIDNTFEYKHLTINFNGFKIEK